MKVSRHNPNGRTGFVTIYMTFAMFTLLPMVGLAIDFSILYNMKARLQRAADAGAIGAGNMVQRSTDVTNPTQNAAIVSAVTRFFNANLRPVPWNTTQRSYSAVVTQDSTTKVRTIQVDATYTVPMLFLRVLGIDSSTVSVRSIAKIRFVNIMIVVDRSGSVYRTGSGTQTNPQIIEASLQTFVGNPATSIFVDGRDVVGLLSFGSNYKLDFAPVTNFQTAGTTISTAINNLYFDTSNSTNTGEGLYQGWYQLYQLANTGALNVILLITDGRPSAFTATFDASAAPYCTDRSPKLGVMNSPVSDGTPWRFPPQTNRGTNGILRVNPPCTGAGCEPNTQVTNSTNCRYAGSGNAGNVAQDIVNFPNIIGPVDHTSGSSYPPVTTFPSTTGFHASGGTASSNAQMVRWAALNYADNVAKAIRLDTTYKPVIYAIGLNFNTASYPNEEPLDADFLARLANDPNYISPTTGLGVYQTGQTGGKYYNVAYNGLGAALQDITGQILRLAAY